MARIGLKEEKQNDVMEGPHTVCSEPFNPNHAKTLYIKAHVNGKKFHRILMGNGLTINVTLMVLLTIGKEKKKDIN